MKIKIDFVSNSSSTSFVYIARDILSKQDFMAAAGVALDSPVASLFEDMFHELKEQIERSETLKSDADIQNYDRRERLTDDIIDRMKKALSEGQTVKVGNFSSENNLAEMTLCTEIFEIESERFFLNAYENYW